MALVNDARLPLGAWRAEDPEIPERLVASKHEDSDVLVFRLCLLAFPEYLRGTVLWMEHDEHIGTPVAAFMHGGHEVENSAAPGFRHSLFDPENACVRAWGDLLGSH